MQYVYNGTVNKYALRFEIAIPLNVTRLRFRWLNRGQEEMPYSIGFAVSDREAMGTPQLNISSRGFVPRRPSGFEVSLPCTGATDREVAFDIRINVTLAPGSVTPLGIHRRKLCGKSATAAGLRMSPGGRGAKTTTVTTGSRDAGKGNSTEPPPPPLLPPSPPKLPSPASPSMSPQGLNAGLLGAVAGAACLPAAAAALALLLAARRRHRRSQRGAASDSDGKLLERPAPPQQRKMLTSSTEAHAASKQLSARPGSCLVRDLADTCSLASACTSCSLPSHQIGASPIVQRRITNPRDVVLEVQTPWAGVTLDSVLMEGIYGCVYRGSWAVPPSRRAAGRPVREEVLIKTVVGTARQDQMSALTQAGILLAGLQHRHISPLLASTVIPGDPRPHLIYPYPAGGNLKLHLIRCRTDPVASAYCLLSTQNLVHMAVQISKGLAYLHRKRVLHRDLACRNCVLAEDGTVRISDAALAKDFFPEDYGCTGDGENRPVKWLSVEALVERKFSPASDVWTLGVTLWELVTRCQQPYPQVDPMDMPRHLRDGRRLPMPTNCPDELFGIMSSCWHAIPDRRPRLPQLQATLARFHETISAYI